MFSSSMQDFLLKKSEKNISQSTNKLLNSTNTNKNYYIDEENAISEIPNFQS
jgi:hypothetical protein